MKVVLDAVSKGRHGESLPETSLEYETGAVVFAHCETEMRPTVLGLIASGRMKPDTGRVTIDENSDAKRLRRSVALVDAPEVSDPHPGVALAAVVGEELMFAGAAATPIHAKRWLRQVGFEAQAAAPFGTIDPAVRVRILCELAVLREGVEGIVLVHPDRHGGSPDGWTRIVREFAERGYAMLVIVGGSAAVAIERMPEDESVHPGDVSAQEDAAAEDESRGDDAVRENEAVRDDGNVREDETAAREDAAESTADSEDAAEQDTAESEDTVSGPEPEEAAEGLASDTDTNTDTDTNNTDAEGTDR